MSRSSRPDPEVPFVSWQTFFADGMREGDQARRPLPGRPLARKAVPGSVRPGRPGPGNQNERAHGRVDRGCEGT
jgi:hypothetical protein